MRLLLHRSTLTQFLCSGLAFFFVLMGNDFKLPCPNHYSTFSHLIVNKPLLMASAWNVDGLQAIGMTTMSGLTSKPHSYVKRLLNNHDLSDIAEWTMNMMQHYPELQQGLHQTYEFSDKEKRCEAIEFTNTSSLSLLGFVENFYDRLSKKAEEVHMVPEVEGISDGEALALFFNYLAVLHQPFHYSEVGVEADDSDLVFFKNRKGELKRISLYSFWEETLIKQMIEMNPSSWNDGWTHVAQVSDTLQMERQRFADLGPALFSVWAKEYAIVSCEINRMVSGASNAQIEQSTIERWKRLIRMHILQAGARLAVVLNALLKDKDLTLRSNTIFRTFATEKRQTITLPEWSQNLITNLIIIAVVLALFVYITKFYASGAHPASPAAGRSVFHEKELAEKHS